MWMIPWGLEAQVNTDCETAIVICTDDTFSFKPQGRGKDDFENPNTHEGCLEERERISAWYYFEFRADMPPNSKIEFTIKALQGGNTDFDFAIYGADLNCDSLGMPLRCSFSDPNIRGVGGDTTGLRPYTLRRNSSGQVIDTVYQTEFSESDASDPLGRPADGFVAPMEEQPTQGFYLLLDFFQRDFMDDIDVIDFQLTWGGSAAPYLNCIANPRCIEAYAEAGPAQEVCAGDQTLQLQGAAFNTNGGETYIWEGSGNTSAFLSDPNALQPQIDIPADFSGEIVYKLRVEEGRCIKEDSVFLNVKAGPMPEITGDTKICPGESGQIEVNPGFDSYQWADNTTGRIRTVSQPGEYRVSVSDGSGCPGVGLISVGTHPIPEPIITGEPGFCPGGETTLAVNSEFQTFNWSNGGSNREILIDQPGEYQVTVTTQEGCQAIDTKLVIEYPEPSPPISGPNYLCEGGSITLDAGPYESFSWTGGQQSRTIRVDAPGTYSVTVTDANQCVGSGSKDITVRSNPEPTITGETVICSGASTVFNAGLGYQDYRWSTGESTNFLTVRQAGEYTVTVTDVYGCEGVDRLRLDTITAPRPEIAGATTFCRGDSVFLDVGAGYSSYRWSNGTSQERIKVKTGGTFGVTVTNDLGCPGSTEQEVRAFDKRPPELNSRYALCTGDSVTLDAGPGFQDYQWSTSSGERQLTVAAPGSYMVTVTDENGCVTSREAFVEEFSIVEPVIRGQDEFCSGQSISLFVEGPYISYRWSSGDTLPNTTVTDGGSYQVTVTDANGCSTSRGKEVLEKPSPLIDIMGDTLFCEGGNTVLSVDPGYASYTWSDGRTEPTITVTEAGFYGVVVRAENGCTSRDETRVEDLDAPQPAILPEAFYCPNESVTLDAGEGYLSYRWSDNSSSRSIEVNEPGIYEVTVTNAANCPGAAQTIVYQLPGPQPDIETQQTFCEGTQAVLRADSNFVAYRWSTGDTSYTVEVAEAGDYEVTVVDADGCEAGKRIELEEIARPDFEVSGDRHFCEGASVTLGIEGIFASYQWSTGSQRRSIEVDSAGTYAVTVTNQSMCQTVKSLDIEKVITPVADAGDPGSLDCRQPLIRIGGTQSTGGERYDYQWSGPGINDLNNGQLTPAVGEGGEYILQVVDTVFGCTSSPDTVQVTDLRFDPLLVVDSMKQLTCRSTSVTLDASASDKRSTFTYTWTNGEDLTLSPPDPLKLEVNEPGLFYFRIEDTATGCQARQSILVTADRTVPTADAGPDRQLDCRNDAVKLDASGTLAGQDLSLLWIEPSGDTLETNQPFSPTVDAAGTYVLQVNNTRNGCNAADSTSVRINREIPEVDAGADRQLECDVPEVTLFASATYSGSAASYSWTRESDPGFNDSGPSLRVDREGIYTILVTDTENGCTGRDTVEVIRNANVPAGIQVNAFPPTCFGDADGSIEIEAVNGGEGPYLYRLNEGPFSTGQRFEGLTAGDYRVTVQDINGCEHSLEAMVEDGNDLMLDVGEDRTIKLGSSTTIQALVNIPPGEVEFFQWEIPDTLSNDTSMTIVVRPFQQTLYSAIVVDSNGCKASDNVTITVIKDDQLYIPNAFSPNNDGHNDRFYVFTANEFIKINYLKIFQRWGGQVFEVLNPQPNDPAFGWDGRLNGRFLNAGVYVYFLEVEYPDGETELLKGDVSLIR